MASVSQQGPQVVPGSSAPGRAVRPSRYPAVAGAVAALWSLAVGLAVLSLIVLGLWVLAPNGEGGAVSAWRGAGLVWLAAHQTPMLIANRELTLLPIGAVLPALLILRRAGLWAGRIVPSPTTIEAAVIIVAGAVLYGAGGAGIAWITASVSTGALPVNAGLTCALVAAIGLLWGVGAVVGWHGAIRERCADSLWRIWVGGLAAFTGLFALGAALVTAGLVVQFSDVATTLRSLHAGPAGELGLTLLGIFALPTMALWAMAVAVGGTVDFGSSGQLSAFGGELGQLPALPALASLPPAVPSAVAWAMVLPILLGVLAGRIRWGRDLPTLSGVATSTLGLAVVVGLLTAGGLLLSTGSLGGDRMAAVGPVVLPGAGAAAGLVALGFLFEAGFQWLRLTWQLHRAESARTVDLPVDLRDQESELSQPLGG